MIPRLNVLIPSLNTNRSVKRQDMDIPGRWLGLSCRSIEGSSLAGGANAEDFEPVTFDAEVGLRGEFPDKLIDVAALELHHASAF